MLPEYISMRVAESILFAGKAVRVLRNPSPTFRFQDIPKGSQTSLGSKGLFSFQRESLLDTKSIGEKLLPQVEADKIESMLQDLKVFLRACNYYIVTNGHFHILWECMVLLL